MSKTRAIRAFAFAAAWIAALPVTAQTIQTNPTGYYIGSVAERTVETLPAGPLYWRVETYPTLGEASAGGGPYSFAASISGRHWRFTLGSRADGQKPAVAEIGPVSVPTAKRLLLRINHAGGPPKSETPVHTHPGSEAIYVLKGEISQRTPTGVHRASAGETLNAHAPEMPMQIVSSGSVDLEQLVMFVVDADRPFSSPAKF